MGDTSPIIALYAFAGQCNLLLAIYGPYICLHGYYAVYLSFFYLPYDGKVRGRDIRYKTIRKNRITEG